MLYRARLNGPLGERRVLRPGYAFIETREPDCSFSSFPTGSVLEPGDSCLRSLCAIAFSACDVPAMSPVAALLCFGNECYLFDIAGELLAGGALFVQRIRNMGDFPDHLFQSGKAFAQGLLGALCALHRLQ